MTEESAEIAEEERSAALARRARIGDYDEGVKVSVGMWVQY